MSLTQTTYDFHHLLLLTEDDPEFRTELIEKYVHTFQTFPEEFAQLVRARDAEGLVFLVHRVKATVRMVGGDELDRLLEQSSRLSVDKADPEQMIERVASLCAQLVLEIRRL